MWAGSQSSCHPDAAACAAGPFLAQRSPRPAFPQSHSRSHAPSSADGAWVPGCEAELRQTALHWQAGEGSWAGEGVSLESPASSGSAAARGWG